MSSLQIDESIDSRLFPCPTDRDLCKGGHLYEEMIWSFERRSKSLKKPPSVLKKAYIDDFNPLCVLPLCSDVNVQIQSDEVIRSFSTGCQRF